MKSLDRFPMFLMILALLMGCGVKSAPLPPLNETPQDSERTFPRPSPQTSPVR